MSQARISVLYFSNAIARGGAEQHMLTLLQGLDRRRFRSYLACTPELAEELRPDLPVDVPLIPLRLRKPWHVGAALRLARILRKHQIDILHSHLFYSSLFGSPIGWACRVPVILETPHVAERWRRGWFKSHYGVDRLAGCFVDYYIAVSKANRRYLLQEKSLPREKIIVIYNGCDLSRFDPKRPAPAELKRSLGFAESDPVLAVIGRLEPQKGHRVVLEALPLVRGVFPGVRLVCVGEGSLRSALEEHARGSGLQEAVRFVGHQPNVADWLALADLTVLPSFYEGLPLVAIESLATGRPVVATAVDGTPEVVLDGMTGLTVPPGNPTRLAEAVCRLLRDPHLRRQFARSGRAWVQMRFRKEQQVRQTEELYLRAFDETRTAAERAARRAAAEFAPPEDEIARSEEVTWATKQP